MENRFTLQNDVALIEVPYKNTIVTITIDREDIDIASSIPGKWVLCYKNKEKEYFYILHNQDKSVALHKLILGVDKHSKVFFKDKNYTNLRKSNLSINSYETDETFRQKRKEAYQKMSKEGKARLFKGIRENRYSKDWSDKLAEKKKGTKNPTNKLTPEIVYEIRKLYRSRQFTQQSLANLYGIARTTVADIVNYRIWNELGEHPNKVYRIYKENRVIPFDVKKYSPLQYTEFTNKDILYDEFVLELQNTMSDEKYIFCQKIGDIKLYVEIRDKKKQFIYSFEVVFPEFLTPQHIHNYVITQTKPKHYLNRHLIHQYMALLSTHLFADVDEKTISFFDEPVD